VSKLAGLQHAEKITDYITDFNMNDIQKIFMDYDQFVSTVQATAKRPEFNTK